jgi:hypothetical protein
MKESENLKFRTGIVTIMTLMLTMGCKQKEAASTVNTGISSEITHSRFRFHIDKKEIGKADLTLGGWAIVRNIKSASVSGKIVLGGEDGDHVYPIKFHARPDVTAFFKSDSTNYDNSGFLVKIPMTELKRGVYGIVIIYHVDKDYNIPTGESVSLLDLDSN